LRMLMVVNLIDAMLPHLAQAARCRHRPQRASRRPSSAFTIVAPAATARNNTDSRNPVLDPRDTGIIANRAATVVNEVRVSTLRYNYSSSLRYFCPPCFTMTHERPLVCVGSPAPSTTRRENASTAWRCRRRGHWRRVRGDLHRL
jgi:hypothetical protein